MRCPPGGWWNGHRNAELKEAREKETAGEEKEEPPRKFSEGISRSFADLNKLLKKPENMDLTLKGFHE